VITLVLGGSRSGKSAVAEHRATAHGDVVAYLATAQVHDDDFAARVHAHQARRPAGWTTHEVGAELVPALASVHGVALVDSLGTWVAAHHDFVLDVDELCGALVARADPTVLVSDEVGMGVHPETPLGRRFRDVLGEVNQAVAAVADEVLLVVAGRTLALPPS
jgi:adenosyl cobinamide kinase/adenosyl cobinamide phosphate guanylyltransferase